MIRPSFIVVVDTVLLDSTTNSLSLIKLYEQFYPVGYPLLIPRFTLVAMYEREVNDPQTVDAIMAVRLDDEVVHEHRYQLNFVETMVNRSVLQFEGFVVARPGVIRATATVGEQTVRSYPIPAYPAGTAAPRQVA